MIHLRTNAFLRHSALWAILLLLVGCAVRSGDLTLLSTRNIDLSNATIDVRQGKRVVGEDCVPVILVPLGSPNLQEATDDALEKGAGNVMVDQVTRFTMKAFLFGVSCIESEGTVLNIATAH